MSVPVGLDGLPLEVITDILCYLRTSEDLKACRLTCRALNWPAAKCLFSHLILRPDETDTERVASILDSDVEVAGLALGAFVEQLIIITQHTPEEFSDRYLDIKMEEPESLFSIIKDIHRFPCLKSVTVEFTEDLDTDRGGEKYDSIDRRGRDNLLPCLFKALDRTITRNKLQMTLELENLDNHNGKQLIEHLPEFRHVLSSLSELRFGFGASYEDCDMDDLERIPQVVEFFADLNTLWLRPAQNTITRLSLVSDKDWGFIPKFDPSGLFFPRLLSLALCKWQICREADIEWVTSHKDTLEDLTFTDCAIVYHVLLDDELQGAHKPSLDDMRECKHIEHLGESIWTYDARWHQIFDKLGQSLPKLKRFRMISLPSDSEQLQQHASEELTLFDLHIMINNIHPRRYAMFDNTTGPGPWLREGEEGQVDEYLDEIRSDGTLGVAYEEEFDPTIQPGFSGYSASIANHDADTAALKRLLAVVMSRAV